MEKVHGILVQQTLGPAIDRADLITLLEPPIQGHSPVLFDVADEDATVIGDILLICPTDDAAPRPDGPLVRLISSSVTK